MTADARQIAVVRDYEGLLQALRMRRDQLQITHLMIDDVSGIQSGYTSKLLADPPMKRMGAMSFGAVLGALGLQLAVIEDPAGLRRLRQQSTTRKRPVRKLPIGSIPWLINKLSTENMNKKRKEKVPEKRRKAIARKAAKARWRKPKLKEIKERCVASNSLLSQPSMHERGSSQSPTRRDRTPLSPPRKDRPQIIAGRTARP